MLSVAIQILLKCSIKEVENLNTCHQPQFLLEFLVYAKGWLVKQKWLMTITIVRLSWMAQELLWHTEVCMMRRPLIKPDRPRERDLKVAGSESTRDLCPQFTDAHSWKSLPEFHKELTVSFTEASSNVLMEVSILFLPPPVPKNFTPDYFNPMTPPPPS